MVNVIQTSRDRPKSASYRRLKNSKKTSNCQVFPFTVLENWKFYEKNFSKKLHTQKNGPSGALKEGHFRNCQHFYRSWEGFVAKHQKIEMGETFLFSEKNLTVLKKTEKRDPLGFSNIHSVAKYQKNWRGTLWGKKNSRKKVSQCRKKFEGGTLMVCYAGKQEKPFWFSSLDQIVQFGAVKFCRTFVELFWSVRVDWKKRKAIILVAFHFMKRRLKTSCFSWIWNYTYVRQQLNANSCFLVRSDKPRKRREHHYNWYREVSQTTAWDGEQYQVALNNMNVVLLPGVLPL